MSSATATAAASTAVAVDRRRARSRAAWRRRLTVLAFAIRAVAAGDVLIVAPSPIESTLVARRLMRWGARVSVVPSGEAAGVNR